jgi:hypothetical protein
MVNDRDFITFINFGVFRVNHQFHLCQILTKDIGICVMAMEPIEEPS